ncbi:hypothetical protein PISMIDRAFT_690035 [Pisolithus microcarpus 441]|uniref:Uncharacterized protein n=1 Tax=Pisolithus microcarpus 441 TaxID=765257 RepID=A0A0C9YDB0_9AGAM|nr:hypothetical protein BKA83DRAFT_690035 [Pisolithus microcarpus]KIK11789.1 hypothetical protein PISMIDRAFT_690035 [Pisolithus microcarpus 441]
MRTHVSYITLGGDDVVQRPRHSIHPNMCFHVLGKKTEKDGTMTYAHRETNTPLSIQVWEQGARPNKGFWAGQSGDGRAISIRKCINFTL